MLYLSNWLYDNSIVLSAHLNMNSNSLQTSNTNQQHTVHFSKHQKLQLVEDHFWNQLVLVHLKNWIQYHNHLCIQDEEDSQQKPFLATEAVAKHFQIWKKKKKNSITKYSKIFPLSRLLPYFALSTSEQVWLITVQ